MVPLILSPTCTSDCLNWPRTTWMQQVGTITRSSDGVQNTLSLNMAPRHIGCFKLKDFEKMAKSERSVWPPSHLSPLKQVPKLLERGRGALPTPGERSILSLKTEMLWRIRTNGSYLLHLQYALCPVVFLPAVHSSSNLTLKYSGWTVSWGLYFFMKAPVSWKP